MAKVQWHKTNKCNLAIEIDRVEADSVTPHSRYAITFERKDGSKEKSVLQFQDGPIEEVGTNGLTHEALLSVMIDRLRGFQAGPFACHENAMALKSLEDALHWHRVRTGKRTERGVEGTHTP